MSRNADIWFQLADFRLTNSRPSPSNWLARKNQPHGFGLRPRLDVVDSFRAHHHHSAAPSTTCRRLPWPSQAGIEPAATRMTGPRRVSASPAVRRRSADACVSPERSVSEHRLTDGPCRPRCARFTTARSSSAYPGDKILDTSIAEPNTPCRPPSTHSKDLYIGHARATSSKRITVASIIARVSATGLPSK